jgi:hypothetical protein
MRALQCILCTVSLLYTKANQLRVIGGNGVGEVSEVFILVLVSRGGARKLCHELARVQPKTSKLNSALFDMRLLRE